jgi:antirestriction protein
MDVLLAFVYGTQCQEEEEEEEEEEESAHAYAINDLSNLPKQHINSQYSSQMWKIAQAYYEQKKRRREGEKGVEWK